jgi:hypothetical protein
MKPLIKLLAFSLVTVCACVPRPMTVSSEYHQQRVESGCLTIVADSPLPQVLGAGLADALTPVSSFDTYRPLQSPAPPSLCLDTNDTVPPPPDSLTGVLGAYRCDYLLVLTRFSMGTAAVRGSPSVVGIEPQRRLRLCAYATFWDVRARRPVAHGLVDAGAKLPRPDYPQSAFNEALRAFGGMLVDGTPFAR